MTVEEYDKIIEDFKNEGKSEEDILDGLFSMYKDGKLEKDQLTALLDRVGYEVTPEFEKMTDEEAKKMIADAEAEPATEGEDEGKPADEPEEKDESEEAMRLMGLGK